jgi:predicted Zn-dependent peptidase
VTLALPLDVKRSDAEYTAMVVTHELLGAGFESRLVAELRERRNLTYSIDSHLRTYRGHLPVHLGHRPPTLMPLWSW